MKQYTISATCTLLPVSYIASDEFDYYFTTVSSAASIFCETEVDNKIVEYQTYHPEYSFSKTETLSK